LNSLVPPTSGMIVFFDFDLNVTCPLAVTYGSRDMRAALSGRATT